MVTMAMVRTPSCGCLNSEKRNYVSPKMEIVDLRHEIPLVAYSDGEFNLNESEKKYFA
jgi:hypothetical protein